VRRPRFHTTQALTGPATLILEEGPSRHIAKTLRMRPGDPLCLFDGHGHEAAAVVGQVERGRVSVEIEAAQAIDRESPLATTLAIGVSRGDRMDTAIQKATQLGVTRVWPVLGERTGVRLDSTRWEKKLRHWQQVAISACEQCGRNRLPEIAAPAPLDAVLRRSGDCDLRLLLHPAAAQTPLPDACASLCLLVGPEGGFSDAEVADAEAVGFRGFGLGPRILRTETAPLAALAIAQARWGDLSAA
jgi:16S rRNA (uracil1498-N3)-methyltransferase